MYIVTILVLFLLMRSAYAFHGTADPCRLWPAFASQVTQHYPCALNIFGPQASDEELRTLSTTSTQQLPTSFITMLRHCNGESRGQAFGLFYGTRLLSVEEILDERASLMATSRAATQESLNDHVAIPTGTIQPAHFDHAWLPFAKDCKGAFLALDFNPGPNGTHGQVIAFNNQDNDMLQVAPSFDDFLILMADIAGDTAICYRQSGGHENSGPLFAPPLELAAWLRQFRANATCNTLEEAL